MITTTYTLSFSIYTGKTWLAQVTGFGGKYGVERDFVSGSKDSSKSGKTGYYTYELEDGIYEECERGKRRFIRVENGEITEISRDDAKEIIA